MNSFSNIWSLLQTLVALGIAWIFIMCIISFFLAIRDFIRSEWDPQSTKNGWNRIRFMIIGIWLTALFLFILPLLIQYIGVDNYELFSAQSIFTRIWELMNWIFSIWPDFHIS